MPLQHIALESEMAQPIKTMSLYHQVERVYNELKAVGVGSDDAVDVGVLSAFDQYHYYGTEAVDEAIAALGLNSGMEVLEVGSGIGGPARYLAHVAGCRMTALELQPDLNEVARNLTRRCDLAHRIEHLCGDILAGSPDGRCYDALVSWLTFLHIADRPALYARCHEAIKPGGAMYVEDYFARGTLQDAEKATLSREVYCDHIPTMQEYHEELARAGFTDIVLTDMSAPWTRFVRDRYEAFLAARERNIQLHGDTIVRNLMRFYETIVTLFQTGNLGGIRLTAKKPA